MATILAVDNEPDTIEALRLYLGTEGFDVITDPYYRLLIHQQTRDPRSGISDPISDSQPSASMSIRLEPRRLGDPTARPGNLSGFLPSFLATA